uniref:Uncharacterized protein n=1 Tax=Arundo donax TaxID=35708 RepID=A0A0A9GF96_ARUDO
MAGKARIDGGVRYGVVRGGE